MVRTQCFHCHGQGSIPGRGTKIPQATWHGQKQQQKQVSARMWRNWNSHTLLWKFGSSSKSKTWSYHMSQQFYSKKNENLSPYKNLYVNVHSSISHNSQKGETTQISTDAWIDKMWYIHTREYYSAIKGNVVLIHTTTRMNLENTTLSEKS